VSKKILWVSFLITALSMSVMLNLSLRSGKLPESSSTGPTYQTTITRSSSGYISGFRTKMVSGGGGGGPSNFIGLTHMQIGIFAAWALLLTFWKKADRILYRKIYALFLFIIWLPCYYSACFLDFPWPTLVIFALVIFASIWVGVRLVGSRLGFDDL